MLKIVILIFRAKHFAKYSAFRVWLSGGNSNLNTFIQHLDFCFNHFFKVTFFSICIDFQELLTPTKAVNIIIFTEKIPCLILNMNGVQINKLKYCVER